MICNILTDVNPSLERSVRLKRMVAVLAELGYECHAYDAVKFINETEAANLESQNGIKNGRHASYANNIKKYLNKKSPKDLIIATEAWHTLCFKNLMEAHSGRYHDMPVVELWIDYPHSFATHRIFSSRYAMYQTYGAARIGIDSFGTTEPWPEWIHAKPHYQGVIQPGANIEIREYTMRSPLLSLAHMDALAAGVPIVAPDWGVWHEYGENGRTGCIYRSEEGFKLGREIALKITSAPIVEWVNLKFSLKIACDQIDRYLSRLSNA